MSEEDTDALNVKEGEKKKVLFTTNGCGYCEDAKENLKPELDSGEISEVHCSDNESDTLGYKNFKEAMDNNIEGFPTLMEVEKREGKLRMCEIDMETKKIVGCRDYRRSSEEENIDKE